jgi:DNA-binding MarR family transcriptional regulator
MSVFLGCDRSALSRELARMKEEGLIDYYRNSFKVLK